MHATYKNMKKEVLLAILAGISIGLVIAFGSWRLTKTIKKSGPVITKKETPQKSKLHTVSLAKYVDYDVITEPPTLTGIGAYDSDIVILTNEKDFYARTNTDGEFEKKIELPGGLSQLKIVSISDEGDTSEYKIKLVYSTEFNKYLVDEDDLNQNSNQASQSANSEDLNSIRQKVSEKLSKINNEPKSYVGTITDISGESLQIKSEKGDIEQISTSKDTTYINSLKKNSEIKLIDLAIGDYIIAMGFINDNKVLDSKRIIISSPITENKYQVIWGKVREISKTKITIDTSSGEKKDIQLPKKWVGPDTKEIKENDLVLITGQENESKFELRSIIKPQSNP